jgi:hypothetical protein
LGFELKEVKSKAGAQPKQNSFGFWVMSFELKKEIGKSQPNPKIFFLQPKTHNPKPTTQNPQPKTCNSKPATQNKLVRY